jgi:transposase InsO family protein
MSLTSYLELLDWAGQQLASGKRGQIPSHLQPILRRLGIDSPSWCRLTRHWHAEYNQERPHSSLGYQTPSQFAAGLAASAAAWAGPALQQQDQLPCLETELIN